MMPHPALAIVVMAKAPRSGFAKTRLAPLLGLDGAAALQAELIRSTTRWAVRACPSRVFLAYAPADAQAEMEALAAPGARLLAQSEGDLGARLSAAVSDVARAGLGPIVVVAADAPTVGPLHVDGAAAALQAGADVCFGPALDGGYYLVALTEPRDAIFGLPSELWGGPHVLGASLELARRAGLTTALLDPERDLDDAEDALALARDPRVPASILELLSPPTIERRETNP